MKKMRPLSNYLKIYERNPGSKVFAPLAESYRRLGMHQEAIKVLKKGLASHPHYTAARVILGHIYYDTQKYKEALKILEPLAPKNLDNYTLQKLYAHSNLKLGLEDKAREVFKHLLFLNPRDQEVADILDRLEARDSPRTNQTKRPTSKENQTFVEEWVQVDFARKRKAINGDFTGAVEEQKISKGHSLPEDPIVTHTLVDLYEQQGFRDKAAQVLEKIIELNPNDTSSITRLQNLKQENLSRHSGHQALMEVWDQKFSKRPEDRVGLKKVLLDFLQAIKLKANNEKSTCY